jgi:hypothetical protein
VWNSHELERDATQNGAYPVGAHLWGWTTGANPHITMKNTANTLGIAVYDRGLLVAANLLIHNSNAFRDSRKTLDSMLASADCRMSTKKAGALAIGALQKPDYDRPGRDNYSEVAAYRAHLLGIVEERLGKPVVRDFAPEGTNPQYLVRVKDGSLFAINEALAQQPEPSQDPIPLPLEPPHPS